MIKSMCWAKGVDLGLGKKAADERQNEKAELNTQDRQRRREKLQKGVRMVKKKKKKKKK